MTAFNTNSLIVRYGFLLVIAITIASGINLFQEVFTPLTVYPSYWLLKLFYGATLIDATTIFVKGYYASIIPACVAGSAYFLLLILNMTTPMKTSSRIVNIAFLWTLFLTVNVLRVMFFSSLLFKGYQYFDFAHLITWYLGSTLLVVAIWFAGTRIFHVKSIPMYSDIKPLMAIITASSSRAPSR